MHKLTELQARNAAPKDSPYKVFDGGGLFLLVQPSGAKYWRMKYRLAGRHGTEALGVYMGKDSSKVEVTLAEARRRAAEVRAMLAAGVDPAEQRRRDRTRAEIEADELAAELRRRREAERQRRAERKAAQEVARNTFETVAGRWVEDRRPHWSDAHRHQVEQSFRDHVFPKIGRRPIASLTSADALGALAGLLAEGRVETAHRIKQRMGGIWRFAVLRGLAKTDVIALASDEFRERRKLALKANPRRNFAAVTPAELPGLLKAMAGYQGTPLVRLGLRLLALTLVRTTELRGATWSEFQLEGDPPTWTIPPERMKVKTRGDRPAAPHVVPLSGQAVAALLELRAMALDPVQVMPHGRGKGKGAVLSENAMLYALYAMGFKGRMTGHGFRAVASTLLHEAGFAHELIEAQLAHEQEDDVARRYNRAEYLGRRREMLQWYADTLDRMERGEPAQVLRLHRR